MGFRKLSCRAKWFVDICQVSFEISLTTLMVVRRHFESSIVIDGSAASSTKIAFLDQLDLASFLFWQSCSGCTAVVVDS